LQVQLAFIPHAVAVQVALEPAAQAHVVVQKCVVLSPMIEHSVADMLFSQSDNCVQNFPTPLSLPVSPGSPHADWNASTASGASGFFALLLLLHAASASAHKMMWIRFRMPICAGTIAYALRRGQRVLPRC
jgi:hypothetical protein